MFEFLGAILCKVRPHKWRRRIKEYVTDGAHPKIARYHSVCSRCGAEREVKTRAKKKEAK